MRDGWQQRAPTEVELIDFTRKHLARYKCPTSVAIVPALPRNASGKVLKRELRNQAQAQATQAPTTPAPSKG